MRKRLHIHYSGMVQGVGFRFTAERVAVSLGITGWVRNLPDGRVETVCEGEEAVLVDFIRKMKEGPMRGYIQDNRVDWAAATGEFSSFSIRYF